jgi:hypothetical protein
MANGPQNRRECFVGLRALIVIIIIILALQPLLGFGRFFSFLILYTSGGRLCGEVVRVLGYRSGGPCSIPCNTRKKMVGVWNGVHSAS